MKAFSAPKENLGDLEAEVAATVINAAADIALIVDCDGVIKDLAIGGDELAQEAAHRAAGGARVGRTGSGGETGHASGGASAAPASGGAQPAAGVGLAGMGWGQAVGAELEQWIGRAWTEVVTVESRPKVEALLRDAAAKHVPRWRHVNHPVSGGEDFPVRYATVPVGDTGNVVALGRDLRSMALLQQRLVGAQQSIDREYARLRHSETRFRLLFQLASEAVLIVDAATRKVVESNPAAVGLLAAQETQLPQGVSPSPDAKPLTGRLFPHAFRDVLTPEGITMVERLLKAVETSGRGEAVTVARADHGQLQVSASSFRQEHSTHYLIRVNEASAVRERGQEGQRARSRLLDVVQRLPDGFVVTDPDGRILAANAAFLYQSQLANESQAIGENLERWLGRPGVDLKVLISNLRQHGSVRLFSTVVRTEFGYVEDVEVSAVAVLNSEPPCLGFTVRGVGRRLGDESASGELPQAIEQMTALVGRVPLKQLVQETTDLIERMCIEAALELTGDNRASAAEMLGLSRQSLYVKLRRFGLADSYSSDGGNAR